MSKQPVSRRDLLKAGGALAGAYLAPLTDARGSQVTAVSDNGESVPSTLGDTDPARLIHWDPKPGEGFRRDTRSHENGYPEYNHWVEERMPILAYPDAGGEAKKDRP